MERRIKKEVGLFENARRTTFGEHTFIRVDDMIFRLNKSYPFVPPSVFIQQKPYEELLAIVSRHSQIGRFPMGPCVCCTTLTRSKNWGPIKTTMDIYKEVRMTQSLLRQIVQRRYEQRCASLIIDKRLYPLCPLYEYL